MPLTPEEILKKVKKIEISTRKTVKNMLSGSYHSRFKGYGMQFSEYREYYYGDDVRHIDWKVTARAQHPYTKLFEEERELTVILAVDISGSLDYGSISLKNEKLIEAAALVAFSAISNNDRVGLLLFSDKVEKFVPPAKGRPHGLRIIRDLIYTKPTSRGTNIQHALKYLNGVTKSSGVIFIASDFLDTGYGRALRVIGKRNDVIAIQIHDQTEKSVPSIGLVLLRDAETGDEVLVDTSAYSFRKGHEEAVKKQNSTTGTLLGKTGVGLVDLDTSKEPIVEIVKYFNRKKYAG